MITLALALALAIPSPVPAARAALHAQGPLLLRAKLDDRSSVVAFGGRTPVAAVMEYSGRWKALPQGSVRVKPLNPLPGAVRAPGMVRLAARFSAASRILAAGFWLDTSAVRAAPKGTFSNFVARALPRQVSTGRHYVVAWAGAPGEALVRVWSFRVR